jgi:hypothetical protein
MVRDNTAIGSSTVVDAPVYADYSWLISKDQPGCILNQISAARSPSPIFFAGVFCLIAIPGVSDNSWIFSFNGWNTPL